MSRPIRLRLFDILDADGPECYNIAMTRNDALNLLRALEPELRKQGLASLYLFGSVARGQANSESDVDLFCDLEPSARLGFGFFGLADRISEALQRRVELTTRDGLHRLIRESVAGEAVQVF